MTQGIMLGFALGVFVAGIVAAVWPLSESRKNEESRIQASVQQRVAQETRVAHRRGRDEALAILVETDENAAIIEAIGSGVLFQRGIDKIDSGVAWQRSQSASQQAPYGVFIANRYDTNGYFDGIEWSWKDPRFERAKIDPRAPTPQGVYRNFKAMLPRVVEICAQMDALEAAQKEARQEAVS